MIIDRLTLDLGPGLNVLTGETGAGKSILLDALGFVLGWRGRAELVRAGASDVDLAPMVHVADALTLAGNAIIQSGERADGRKPLDLRAISCEVDVLPRVHGSSLFQRGETPLIQRIEARIARLLNWPIENGEGLQVLHYRPGAEYKPHYDYFDPAEPGTPTIVQRGGQRVGTLVMYLNTPEKGGGTTFPDVHLEVAPQRGNAVFFSYERPHPSTRTLHGGAPVIAGEKWIATKWLREREFK